MKYRLTIPASVSPIPQIKLFRTITGQGLRESKDVIDKLRSEVPEDRVAWSPLRPLVDLPALPPSLLVVINCGLRMDWPGALLAEVKVEISGPGWYKISGRNKVYYLEIVDSAGILFFRQNPQTVYLSPFQHFLAEVDAYAVEKIAQEDWRRLAV